MFIEQYVGGFQVAVQDAFAVQVHEPDGHFVEDLERIAKRKRTLASEQIFERPVLDVVHDVVRRIGIPSHIQQLNYIAIGREHGQLFNFT